MNTNIIPHNNNSCMGGFGKSLDVKFTGDCNAHCEFCIEKEGYNPKTTNLDRMIETTNNLTEYESVLILGGEPLLYFDKLLKYIENIHSKKIYITTNASTLTTNLAKKLAPYLTGINFSIHHYSKHHEISGIMLNFTTLKKCIKIFNDVGVHTRINANLIPNYLDSKSKVELMEQFAANLGVKSIKFCELQHAELYVDAKNCFDQKLSSEPFTQGCRHTYVGKYVPELIIQQTCGFVNPNKFKPNFTESVKSYTKVIYQDGEARDGWVKIKPEIKNIKNSSKNSQNNKITSCHGTISCHH